MATIRSYKKNMIREISELWDVPRKNLTWKDGVLFLEEGSYRKALSVELPKQQRRKHATRTCATTKKR